MVEAQSGGFCGYLHLELATTEYIFSSWHFSLVEIFGRSNMFLFINNLGSYSNFVHS
jgi:hypothetical protein